MIRGSIWETRLDPTEGSEQAGTRPVVIVSRDALNESIGIVVVVPCTTLTPEKTVYMNQAVLRAPEGGLVRDSIALCEQVRALSKGRLLRKRGQLSVAAMEAVDRALAITLDLA